METLLIILLFTVPVVAERVVDPSATVWQPKKVARNLDCARLPQKIAHEKHPGKIPEAGPRGQLGAEIDAMVCQQRYMQYGERPARDEAILSTLRRSVGELSETASALVPGENVTWHVDAFYPDPFVASKISVAAKTDLAERGRRVSDKVPLLAAGDLVVLSSLSAQDAYEVACTRYQQQKAMTETDAFLGIMLLDERETQLHAGICVNGAWRWLR